MSTSHNKPGCLGVFLQLFGSSTTSANTKSVTSVPTNREPDAPEPTNLPYRLRDDFLSSAERSLFHILHTIFADRAFIYPKVNLQDLFFVADREQQQAHINRIARKHVDFVICHSQTLEPMLAIELDDRSHKRPDRQERDTFVNQVFEAAHLPLVRIPVQYQYNTGELARLLLTHLDQHDPHMIVEESSAEQEKLTLPVQAQAPYCPRCGIRMVVRTATRGTNAGSQFYGCTNYPRCRAVMP